jgi:hypothetical protein
MTRGQTKPTGNVDAWSAFARARALRDGILHRGRVLEGALEGVPIVVDVCMESSLDRFVAHTRVTGQVVEPVAARISVMTRHSLVEPPEGTLVQTGDRDLDARFYVKASPVEPAFKVLGDRLRGSLLGFPHPLMFVYAGDAARLFWEGLEEQESTLELAATAVVSACAFRASMAYR